MISRNDIYFSNLKCIILLSKWENLIRCSTKLLHFCKKTITCLGLKGRQIFSVKLKYICFSTLGAAFAAPFPCYFPKLHLNWIAGRVNMLCKYITIFPILGVLLRLLFYVISESSSFSFSCHKKKIWNSFCCIVLFIVWAQKVSQIFKNIISKL